MISSSSLGPLAFIAVLVGIAACIWGTIRCAEGADSGWCDSPHFVSTPYGIGIDLRR